MLFKKDILNAIELGEVTTAFRVWRRPTVSHTGRLRTAVGELVIEDLREVSRDDISDVRRGVRAGHGIVPPCSQELGDRPGRLYRIDFRSTDQTTGGALAADDDPDTDGSRGDLVRARPARPPQPRAAGVDTRAVPSSDRPAPWPPCGRTCH